MGQRYGDGNDCQFMPVTAISGTTPIPSNVIDMRPYHDVGLQLITTGTVAGTWLIEASNDFVPRQNSNVYGAVSSVVDTAQGTFSNVTAFFTIAAAGTAIAAPAGSPTNQYAKPFHGLRCRSLRITFTPSSGAGNAQVIGNASSWS